MRPSMTAFTAEIKSGSVTVRRVPCYQCMTCGEIAYSGEVAEALEQIIRTATQTGGAEVEYSKALSQ